MITCGFTIEGIGVDPNVSSATRWTYRYTSATPEGALTGSYRGVQVLLPRSVETSVDPINGRYEVSSFTFELALMDEVATLFLRQAVRPLGSLSSGIIESEGVVPLPVPGHAGKVVYIGDETVRLGTWNGAGYDDCDRGWHSSTRARHAKNLNVYGEVPYWRNRLITFSTHTNGVWRTRWRGFLDDMNTSGQGTVLQLTCRELFAALTGAVLNRATPDLRIYGDLRWYYDAETRLVRATGYTPFYSRVHKLSVTTRPLVCRLGETPMLVPRIGNSVEWFKAKPLPSAPFNDRPSQGPAYELLAVDKQLDERIGGVSATLDLPYPYHPVAIAYALLTSTDRATPDVSSDRYDIFAAPWGADLLPWLDAGSWLNLIEETREIQIEQLYLGWEGTESLLDTIITLLLRPYGFFVTINEQGLLACERFRALDIAQWCEGTTRGLRILRPGFGGTEMVWEAALGSAVDEISAEVGRTPWQEPSRLIIRAREHSRRIGQLSESAIHTYDLRTIRGAGLTQFGDGDGADLAANRLLNQAALAHYAAPRLRFSVPDSALQGMTYDQGRYYAIALGPDDPWFVTQDGRRVTLPSAEEGVTVQFMGMLIARRFDIPTQTYELTLLLVAHRVARAVRWRAPNAVVVDSEHPAAQVYVGAGSELGNIEDADWFKAGDEVVLCHEDGRPWALDPSVRSITEVAGTTITLDSAWADDPVLFPELLLTLADSTVYDNDAWVSCTHRPWVFQADADGVLDELGEEVEADIYG